MNTTPFIFKSISTWTKKKSYEHKTYPLGPNLFYTVTHVENANILYIVRIKELLMTLGNCLRSSSHLVAPGGKVPISVSL